MPRDIEMEEKITGVLGRFVGREIDDNLLDEIRAELEQTTGGVALCGRVNNPEALSKTGCVRASVDANGECYEAKLGPGFSLTIGDLEAN